ncbi:DUF302 domain-containing protein [Segeticoccus rhizosphaerae]|uniref:DUF302 domain-containing protein n=1 Tax=Segeticoccus rhizosphaerae TaxID=1104777 RepID=UPI0010C11559|nr:DUF302 domain-containing protein [Ornithinicoccus soli]
MTYAISTTLDAPFERALDQVREALSAQGFGVLSQIDIAAALKDKLGVDVPAQVILGACRPQLAHQALQTEPSIGVLLPCNVVVRATGDHECVVEAMDPAIMISLAGNENLREVAEEARHRIQATVQSLQGTAK